MTIEESGFFNGDMVGIADVEDYFTEENMRRLFGADCDDLTQEECDECADEARRIITERETT